MNHPTEKPPLQGVNCGEKIDEALWEKVPCLTDAKAVKRFFRMLKKQKVHEFSLAFLQKDGLIHAKATYYNMTAGNWAKVIERAEQTTTALRITTTASEKISEEEIARYFITWATPFAGSGGAESLRIRKEKLGKTS